MKLKITPEWMKQRSKFLKTRTITKKDGSIEHVTPKMECHFMFLYQETDKNTKDANVTTNILYKCNCNPDPNEPDIVIPDEHYNNSQTLWDFVNIKGFLKVIE